MNDQNITQHSYLFGLGLASDLTKSGSVRFYHYDGLGSTAALTDSAGDDLGHLAYSAFGDTAMDVGATDTRLGFVGRYGVEATPSGLTFMRDRFYDAETGMFLGQDPEVPQERRFLDRASYLYAGGNPVLAIDPAGETWWKPSTWKSSTLRRVVTSPVVAEIVKSGVSNGIEKLLQTKVDTKLISAVINRGVQGQMKLPLAAGGEYSLQKASNYVPLASVAIDWSMEYWKGISAIPADAGFGQRAGMTGEAWLRANVRGGVAAISSLAEIRGGFLAGVGTQVGLTYSVNRWVLK
jgi:RHS repeat-associated protein